MEEKVWSPEELGQSGVTDLQSQLLYLSLRTRKCTKQPQKDLLHRALEIWMYTQLKFIPRAKKCYAHCSDVRTVVSALPSGMNPKQHSVAAGIICCNVDTDLTGRMTMQGKLRISQRRYFILVISYIEITFVLLYRNQCQVERYRKLF